jgi:glycosyltransferase involved in cell wall biosynthesis
MTGTEPILNIAVLCHNHSVFIEKCINSILCQNTSYKYKIIIVDDFSTDGTREILENFFQQNQNKIELILNNDNIGALNSAKILAQNAKAKYVCFLDGDDYWCYENKIQTQIDFLENNPDYAGCFHDAKIEQYNKSNDANYNHRTHINWKTYSQFNRYVEDFMPWDLLVRNIIPTASLIFRNTKVSEFLNNFNAAALSLSWALHLEIIKNSKFKYFNEIWSVYNDHPKGASKNSRHYCSLKETTCESFRKFIKRPCLGIL